MRRAGKESKEIGSECRCIEKVAGKSSDSNSSSMRSPILAGNRILSFMLSVVYIADTCV